MSVEMTPLMKEQTNLSKYVVELEKCGPVEIFVEGDLDKLKGSSSVFLTIHDVGTSYESWVKFTQHEDMKEVKDRSLFLHLSLPGQKLNDEDLAEEFVFPDIHTLGMSLVTVLDQLRINRVIVLGSGAGANIGCRFAMNHPTRVHGVVLMNCNPEKGDSSILNKLKGRKASRDEDSKQNVRNVAKFEESYKKRDEITSLLATKMKAETLLMVGAKNKNVKGSEEIHKQVKAGICSIIKIEEVDNVLEEAEEKAADAIILFCQGVCLLPTVQRKISRQMSNNLEKLSEDGDESSTKLNMTRKVSMEQYDIPNMRRLSLSTHNI